MSDNPRPLPRKRRSTVSSRLSRRFHFVKVLHEDRPFAVVLVLGLVLGGAVMLGVPKLWKTTPTPFPFGEVRVSVLDLVQAWSLSRAARRAEAAGQDGAALLSWRSALVNNQADPALHRGVLGFLGRTPQAEADRALLAIRSASWLVALTRTNLADVALIGDVLERYGRPKVALSWMTGVAWVQDPGLAKPHAKCLLTAGQWEAFAELWRAHGAVWKDDPILAMYQDAWLGGTDDRTSGLEATVRLKGALGVDGETGLTAARLLILVAAVKGQVDDLGLGLQTLEARRSASAAQHGHHWRALKASGRGEEARRLALAYRQVPSDPEMAAVQWRAMRDIGLSNEALGLAEQNLDRFGNDLAVWRAYFDLLVDSRRWNETVRAAANARLKASRQEQLHVEALFAEYRASLGEGRKTDEARLAGELAGIRVEESETAIRISSALRSGERVAEALRLMLAHETAFRDWAPYWAELFSVGLLAKDLEVLRRSVGEMSRIEPRNLAWANNRAALLLITGEDPPEALRLTLASLNLHPESPILRINHAMALLATGRVPEAETVLRTLAGLKLNKDVLANYHLAMAETHFALGRKPEAVESAKRVDRSRLLEPQLKRLDHVMNQASESAGR
jgi:tetratricopeptide (TPR) repeat protein